MVTFLISAEMAEDSQACGCVTRTTFGKKPCRMKIFCPAHSGTGYYKRVEWTLFCDKCLKEFSSPKALKAHKWEAHAY